MSTGFSNAAPEHAKVNPLRIRADHPHIWFEGGYWRCSPVTRAWRGARSSADWALWSRAHDYIARLNMRLRFGGRT